MSFFFQDQEQGFGKNLFTNQYVNRAKDMAIRQKLLYEPDNRDALLLSLDYEMDHSSPVLIPAPGTTPLGGPPYTGSPWGANGYYQPLNREKQGGVSLKYDHRFEFGTLESLTAYLRSSLYSAFDGSLIVDPQYALNVELWDLHSQFTQELNIRSTPDSSFRWTGGVFLYNADARYDPFRLTGNLIAPLSQYNTISNSHAYSVAGYAQATKTIFKQTNLTLGLRYTWEMRHLDEAQYGFNFGQAATSFGSVNNAKMEARRPTWRISIDHTLTDGVTIYASYNRGFKSRGFNDLVLPLTPYAPETLDAYEVGSKLNLFGQRLRIGASGFYYDDNNIQTVSYPTGTELIRAGKAHIYGLDLDFQTIPINNFTISGGLELLHNRFTSFPDAQRSTPAVGGGTILSSFDATGKRLPLAPDVIFNISPLYTLPLEDLGSLSIGGTAGYNGGLYFEPDNRLHQGAYTVINAMATWTTPSRHYSLELWSKNLTNKAYTTAMYSLSNGDYAIYAPPHTVGLTAKFTF